MALIAGCQMRHGKTISHTAIADTLRNFQITSGDDLASYSNSVIATRSCCLVYKYKKQHPIPPQLRRDDRGNSLLTLGFFSSPPVTLSGEQLERSEGEFIAVLAETCGRLHLVNDRFGSRPFYIFNGAEGIYFSSNLAFLIELVGGKLNPDILGWFHVFSYGHTFGNQTTFRHVERLPPATHATISTTGILEQRRYWRLEYSPSNDLDPYSYAGKVFGAFREGASLRSRLVGKGVLALSGGLDSRLVAASLPDDVQFYAFTFVNSGETSSTPDTEVASQVSNLLGLKHNVEKIPQQDFSAIGEDVIRLTGGMKPLHHSASVMPYVREIKRRGLNFLLGGGPGDISAGSKIPSLDYLDPRRTDPCVRDFCRSLSGGTVYLERLFQSDLVKAHHRQVYGSLLQSFDETTGPTAAHKVTAWEMLNRWPAFTFTSVFHSHPDVTEAFCHLDYRYAEMMLKVPAEWLYQRNFYSLMIHDCLPKLRDIIYANTGQLLSGELQRFEYDRSSSSAALCRARQIARNVIPWKIKRLLRPIQRGVAPFQYDFYRRDDQLLEHMSECLISLSTLREILNANNCLRFIREFKADAPMGISYNQQTELIGALATMCLTFRLMTDSRRVKPTEIAAEIGEDLSGQNFLTAAADLTNI